jgi:dolichyl-phosphate mannosyltransferase polypeptide 2 regulatory subunit
MVLYDATIGNVLHALNTAAVAYFVCWIAVTPFVDDTHFTQGLFLPREYGLVLPALMVVVFFLISLTVAAVHLSRVDDKELTRMLDHASDTPAPTPQSVFAAADATRAANIGLGAPAATFPPPTTTTRTVG